jgi:diacylglycerol O-acyltransferase-1
MRHIYAPSLRSGTGSMKGMLISFFASAALHEVLISVPMHTIQFHAFFGMLAQVSSPFFFLPRFAISCPLLTDPNLCLLLLL